MMSRVRSLTGSPPDAGDVHAPRVLRQHRRSRAMWGGMVLLLTLGVTLWFAGLDSAKAQAKKKDDPKHPESAIEQNGDARKATPKLLRGKLTEEQLDKALEILDDIDPELAKEVRKVKGKDLTKAQAMLKSHIDTIARLMEIRESDPTGYRLRIKDIQLGRKGYDLARQITAARAKKDQAARDKAAASRDKIDAEVRKDAGAVRRAEEAFKKAEAEENAELEKLKRAMVELEATLSEHFDVRQQLRRHELNIYELKLRQLRDRIAEREELKKQIIEAKKLEMLGETPIPDF